MQKSKKQKAKCEYECILIMLIRNVELIKSIDNGEMAFDVCDMQCFYITNRIVSVGKVEWRDFQPFSYLFIRFNSISMRSFSIEHQVYDLNWLNKHEKYVFTFPMKISLPNISPNIDLTITNIASILHQCLLSPPHHNLGYRTKQFLSGIPSSAS